MKWNQGITSGILHYQNGRTPAYLVFQAFAILFHKRNGNTFTGKHRVSWLICGFSHNCIEILPSCFLHDHSLPNLQVCVGSTKVSTMKASRSNQIHSLQRKKQIDEKLIWTFKLGCCTNACDSPFRGLQKKSVWDRIPSCDKGVAAFKKSAVCWYEYDHETINENRFHEIIQRACRVVNNGVFCERWQRGHAFNCRLTFDLSFLIRSTSSQTLTFENPHISTSALDAAFWIQVGRFRTDILELAYRWACGCFWCCAQWKINNDVVCFRFFHKNQEKVMAGIKLSLSQ